MHCEPTVEGIQFEREPCPKQDRIQFPPIYPVDGTALAVTGKSAPSGEGVAPNPRTSLDSIMQTQPYPERHPMA